MTVVNGKMVFSCAVWIICTTLGELGTGLIRLAGWGMTQRGSLQSVVRKASDRAEPEQKLLLVRLLWVRACFTAVS